MKTNKKLFTEIATNQAFSKSFNLLNNLPNPDNIFQNTGRKYSNYRDLLNDPHLWSCIQSRKSGVLALDFEIKQAKASSKSCSLINAAFEHINLNQLIRDILDAPLFGFQPLEIMWGIFNFARNAVLPEKIVPKPQEWFEFNRSGELLFKQQAGLQNIPLPDFKFLIVQYEPTYINPYGHSLLGKCYWPVTFKNNGLKFWTNFAEKYGMPILFAKYERGGSYDDAQELADNLSLMVDNNVIVASSEISLEIQEAVRNTASDLFHDLLRFCNSEISKVILSQTLTTELDSGSYAASLTHFKVRREIIMADVRLVESTINTLIKYIIDLNMNEHFYPHFEFKQEEVVEKS